RRRSPAQRREGRPRGAGPSLGALLWARGLAEADQLALVGGTHARDLLRRYVPPWKHVVEDVTPLFAGPRSQHHDGDASVGKAPPCVRRAALRGQSILGAGRVGSVLKAPSAIPWFEHRHNGADDLFEWVAARDVTGGDDDAAVGVAHDLVDV